jgi:hypothetical protein
MILVDHEGTTSLNLGFHDSIPEFLGRDGLASATFFLVTLVESFEFGTVDLVEVGSLIRAKQRPVTIGLDTLHATHHRQPSKW